MLISIIIPVYNVKEYLIECVESVISQSYREIEIILVDDGSTDGSGEICDMFAQKDQRVRCIHKKNEGLVSARAIGAQYARGSYVINVDGDDWIEESRIQNIVDVIKDDIDIIYLRGWYKEYEGRSELSEQEAKIGIYSSLEFLEGMTNLTVCFKREINPSLCCSAIRRELYTKVQKAIDSRLSMGEDITTMFLCALEAEKIISIDEPSYHYVQRPKSINHTLCERDIYKLKLMYLCLKKELDCRNVTEIMYRRIAFIISRLLASVGDKSFFGCEKNFLFPYISIIPGSRIIVYGAGDVGGKLVDFLQQSKDYNCSGWIDKYSHGKVINSIVSEPIAAIEKKEFDFIAVAIVSSDISQNVKRDLMILGVPESKIALMSPDAITIERTEKCLIG